LPIKELFIKDNVDYPLNLQLIADHKASGNHLHQELLKEQPKYKQTLREGNKIYVHSSTDTIYVSASLHESILQWYQTTP
jgi:hypothetical protein